MANIQKVFLLGSSSNKCSKVLKAVVFLTACFVFYHLLQESLMQIKHWSDEEIQDNCARNQTVNPEKCCLKTPSDLLGYLAKPSSQNEVKLVDVERENPLLQQGGYYRPLDCVARWKVAIILPYRNREEHLKIFLQNMHPILQRQQLEYRVYVINQDRNGKFNRAKLLNVGFKESLKDLNFDCFVFHDVDLILQNDKCLYVCSRHPQHLSVQRVVDGTTEEMARNGGVTLMTKGQFKKVNGFPNNYWGWGGEDEDMYQRAENVYMRWLNPPADIGSYWSFAHGRDVGNEVNPEGAKLIYKVKETMNKNGLNNLSYKVVSNEMNKLYTNITVNIVDY